jgi:Na+/H+ antiporter NhaD/arsenite permease-like protein
LAATAGKLPSPRWRCRWKAASSSAKRKHVIIDEPGLAIICMVLFGVFLGLFLSPIHGQEAAWFCLLGTIVAAVLMSTHHIHHVLEAVEWDTLLFFASLFVFVEALAELGLIRAIANALASIIKEVSPASRLPVAMVLFLWVSGIGSAFLESLPYTTAVTYVLINLDNNNDLGIPIDALAWALSVGACIGGIGSIMGSSANLVAMSVSQRYSPDRALEGKHFLQHGFPLLVVLLVVATLYQYILFTVIEPYKCEADAVTGELIC